MLGGKVARNFRNLLLVSIMTALTPAIAAYGEEIKIGGGGAAISGIIIPAKETFEEETGIILNASPSQPGRALIDLQQGLVDAIVSAHSLDHLLEGAAKENVTINPKSLKYYDVGKNRTVIFLHKSNKIKKLDKKQLQSIFAGEISNWKQVGGKDEKIIIVWSPSTPGQSAIFTREILDGKQVVPAYLTAAGYEDTRAKVIANPGSIGIGPHGLIASAVNVPDTPEVSTPVILVTKGKPSAKVKKLITFLQETKFIQ